MARSRTRRRVRIAIAAAVVGIAVGIGYSMRIGHDAREDAPVCATGPTVAGIDVSYYQGEIAWNRVRRAGIRYAFIRVSDGASIADSQFVKNWSAARHAGVLRGAYQYFRPEQDALAQADLMANLLARDPGELPPVIDVETDGGRSAHQLAVSLRAWTSRVRERTGIEPIIYTGPEFWKAKLGGADLTNHALWIAHYTHDCPTVPAPWTRWTIWQHTDNGRVPGIEGPVDLDVFAGTVGDLRRLARGRRAGSR